MKRYLVFYGDILYPQAAMGDFKGDFYTLEEAKAEIEKLALENPYYKTLEKHWKHKWAKIWDCETQEEIWHKCGNEF